MTEELYRELAWLPRPAEDFTKRCRALRDATGSVGREVRALAAFGLDENKLARLANSIGTVMQRPGGMDPLLPFRLGIISNATSHFMVPALVATAARYGFALEPTLGST